MDVDVGTSAGGGAVEVLASVGLGTDVETNVSVADSSRALSGIGEAAGAMTGTGVGRDGLDDGGCLLADISGYPSDCFIGLAEGFRASGAPPPYSDATHYQLQQKEGIHPSFAAFFGRTGDRHRRRTGVGAYITASPHSPTLPGSAAPCVARHAGTGRGMIAVMPLGPWSRHRKLRLLVGGRTGDDPVMAGRLFHPTL